MTTKEVTSSMYQVAQGVDAQAKDFLDIEKSFTKFGSGINNITNEVDEVKESTKEIDKMSIESNEELKKLGVSIDEIGSLFDEMKNNINGLGGNVIRISEITNLINSVAEQTELLSINAAIEAAKAGEAGRGFSVVSQEIKKLATQTKQASHTIDEMVQEVVTQNNDVISTTEFVGGKFKKQIYIVNCSVETFKNIIGAINCMGPKISNIDSSIKGVNEEKANILYKVESVSTVAEQIVGATQEVASSTEEMYDSCVEVEAAAKDLDKTVDILIEGFQKFKLN
jgi:methyl-accepting chemotaxis protein